MIVTIGGPIGSGKTTVAKAIARRFNLRHISAGSVFREMARERGMSLEEFSGLAEKDPSFDKIVDERQRELASEGDAVVDGRLSGRFIDADVKIWLTAPLELRVGRVARREGKDPREAEREVKRREESEALRYKSLYGIDLYDTSGYDVVLNTALWDAEGVVKIIETLLEVKL
ncbi:MAG: AAA family ATPase [Methanobacteriota archaeon]|nr:MAG: AAA family ATPase [Euryarchaeota archaeon]